MWSENHCIWANEERSEWSLEWNDTTTEFHLFGYCCSVSKLSSLDLVIWRFKWSLLLGTFGFTLHHCITTLTRGERTTFWIWFVFWMKFVKRSTLNNEIYATKQTFHWQKQWNGDAKRMWQCQFIGSNERYKHAENGDGREKVKEWDRHKKSNR